jgi:hypothetical protein
MRMLGAVLVSALAFVAAVPSAQDAKDTKVSSLITACSPST